MKVMNRMTQRIQHCPHCGGTIVLHWHNYCRCTACHLILRDPMPSADELNILYSSSWEAPDQNQQETGAMTRRLANSYIDALQRTLGVSTLRGQKILDFGAGRGEMLAVLADREAEVYAVEPFGYAYLEQQGFPVFRDLCEIPPSLQFNGIFSSNVVEHLHTPWETLKSLAALLAAHGWLFVTTPNAEGLHAQLMKRKWREAMKPGHLVFFSPNSLENMLHVVGFEHVQRAASGVDYQQGFLKKILHQFLDRIKVEGELKYLARKKAIDNPA